MTKRLNVFLALILFELVAANLMAAPLSTAFSYQGKLNENNQPASGPYDLRFTIYDAETAGNPIGTSMNLENVPVSNGLFNVTLDFGSKVFTGDARWLEISIRPAASTGLYTTLKPRLAVVPLPYALYAVQAGNAATATTALAVSSNAITSASLVNSNLTSAKIAPGQVVKSINGLKDDVQLTAGNNITLQMMGNAVQISAAGGTGGSSNSWALAGNSGSTSNHFLGTVDNRPLEMRVNNKRALRLEPTASSPNITAGDSANGIASNVAGGTISGGINNHILGGASPAFSDTIAGGRDNSIAGGSSNGSIGGGYANQIKSGLSSATIAGGYGNVVGTNASYGSIVGGEHNQLDAKDTFIGGGNANWIQTGAAQASIAGGINNEVRGNANGAFVGGGQENKVGTNASMATISGGQGHQVKLGSTHTTIGGGLQNQIDINVLGGTIAGGRQNNIRQDAWDATIGGGLTNIVADRSGAATIAGGWRNRIGADSTASTIAGGTENVVDANIRAGTIAGGRQNWIWHGAWDSTIGGGITNSIAENSGASAIAGGWHNRVATNSSASTIAGGKDNLVYSGVNYASIGGGYYNNIFTGAEGGTIPGGSLNYVSGKYGFAAGYQARAEHPGCFVWGDLSGKVTRSLDPNQFVIQAANGVILNSDTRLRFGGSWAQKIELGSPFWGIGTQPGIVYFRSGPTLSPGNGFAWYVSGQHTNASYDPGADGQWLMKLNYQTDIPVLCKEGVLSTIFGTGDAFRGGNAWLELNGSMLVHGAIQASALCESSDRNLKEKIVPVNLGDLLDKVLSLPIAEWSFTRQRARHIGPMAQDFAATFKLGYDDTHITTVDADGVALAAIQGLNKKLEAAVQERDERIARLERRLAALEERLESVNPPSQ